MTADHAQEGLSAEEPPGWNPHWNYHLGGKPRSICACPDGPYEGARHVSIPRFCERCGGLVAALRADRDEAREQPCGELADFEPSTAHRHGCAGADCRCLVELFAIAQDAEEQVARVEALADEWDDEWADPRDSKWYAADIRAALHPAPTQEDA